MAEGARVLIVDDERLGARATADMVEALGHEPVLAHTWTSALQSFTRTPIDLVLMDALMPTVDGFKLTRLLREHATSFVPIVFITGLADREARERAAAAGADDLLTKPVDEVELRIRLSTMLRIRGLTQALEDRTRALDRLAKVDPLTGLLNRRVLNDDLPTELARARRYRRALSLFMLDVDHFKAVNDRHGHDVGDQVLSGLGELLRSTLREADRAYRYGGEELTVLAPETGSERALELAERIRAGFESTTLDAPGGPQTLSIGVAEVTTFADAPDAPTLIRAADRALYRAKRSGRNRVCLYNRAVDERGRPAAT